MLLQAANRRHIANKQIRYERRYLTNPRSLAISRESVARVEPPRMSLDPETSSTDRLPQPLSSIFDSVPAPNLILALISCYHLSARYRKNNDLNENPLLKQESTND